jgi:hypothetical protein
VLSWNGVVVAPGEENRRGRSRVGLTRP